MRIIHALQADIKFQYKQGFYFVYVVLTLFYMLLIEQLPSFYAGIAVPVIIFSDPSFIGFFFIGGIIMLEKMQGILQYLVVTPLKPNEYIVAKVMSLTMLAQVAGFLIAFVTYHDTVNWIILFFGILGTSVFFTLYGFLVTNRCITINQYMIKMIPYLLFMVIPTLVYFLHPSFWVLQFFPSVAGLTIIYGAFHGITIQQFLLFFIYLLILNALFFTYVENKFISSIGKDL